MQDNRKLPCRRGVALVWSLALVASGCGFDGDDSAGLPPSSEAQKVSVGCASAFARAASVSEFHDTHADLFPAYAACRDVEEWTAASRRFPAAIDGADPIRYAMTVCAGNQAELGQTAICRAVNRPDPSATSSLEPSGEQGLLGAPLPVGAVLEERVPGDAAAGRDPSERYRIAADAGEIATFFDQHMPQAGWTKDGLSTPTAIFFQKGDLMLGVLIGSGGGTFTLMGS